MRYCWQFSVFLAIVLAVPSLATVHEVKPDGTGDYPTIQDAINAAVNGDIIELTDGIFLGDGNRDIDYLGRTITVRSQSGNPQACIINCGGGGSHRGFYFHSGEGSAAVLQGVMISDAVSMTPGAGICCDGASPTITNCMIWQNLCPDTGAGLYCSNASPTITGCDFFGNGDATGMSGGGMACILGSSPALTDCTFRNNQTNTGGGGLYCATSSPSLTRCEFSGNTVHAAGGYGGGLFCFNYSSPTLVDCRFIGNAASSGGGVTLYDHSDPSLTDCVFSGNTSGTGGAVYALSICLPTLENCSLSNNTALYYGGAIWCSGSSPALTRCTLSGNSAGMDGGGIHLYQSSPTLDNTIISFSTSGAAVYCYQTGSNPVLTCCDVYGNAGGDWIGCIEGQYGTADNISQDPLYCSAVGEIFVLHSDSPCAGENNPSCGQIGAFGIGCGPSIGVAEDLAETNDVLLFPSSPNPFCSTAQVTYSIPRCVGGSHAVLSIYDSAGRLVRTLVDQDQPAGSYRATWDATSATGDPVAAGVYFYQLRVNGLQQTRRAILTR